MDMTLFKNIVEEILVFFFKIFAKFGYAEKEGVDAFENFVDNN